MQGRKTCTGRGDLTDLDVENVPEWKREWLEHLSDGNLRIYLVAGLIPAYCGFCNLTLLVWPESYRPHGGAVQNCLRAGSRESLHLPDSPEQSKCMFRRLGEVVSSFLYSALLRC